MVHAEANANANVNVSADADAWPDPILILGAGVFGLSTALALLHRRSPPTSPAASKSDYQNQSRDQNQSHPRIHILDASPQLPNPSGSSVDSCRIVRPDYASAPYASLAQQAQRYWRDQSPDGWGGQGRYSETGYALTAADGVAGRGKNYVQSALRNVRGLAAAGGPAGDGGKMVEELGDVEAIRRATGYYAIGPGGDGDGALGVTGYVNWGSGWADAAACVEFALQKLRREDNEDRVVIDSGKTVRRLLFTDDDTATDGVGEGAKPRCTGVELESGEVLTASLVILATGAWTPSLIDLRGRAIATGQVLAYIDVSEAEQRSLETKPVLMNMSHGTYIIPRRGRELKIARHGFGYRNSKMIPCPSLPSRSDAKGRQGGNKLAEVGGMVEVSVPETSISIPLEGEKACRKMLQTALPGMADRPFSRTRICWYCDTPRGDFLIDYHPGCSSLFIATGGSGHGFKFFPVIGEKIVDAIEGCLEPDLRQLWRWREAVEGFQTIEDESRGGKTGMTCAVPGPPVYP